MSDECINKVFSLLNQVKHILQRNRIALQTVVEPDDEANEDDDNEDVGRSVCTWWSILCLYIISYTIILYFIYIIIYII